MTDDAEPFGDSGRTWRKERRLNESESREMSGSGADGESDVGGGGFDFFRSLCAHENRPPLWFLGGTAGDPVLGSMYSFEGEREWAVGCVGNDLVE